MKILMMTNTYTPIVGGVEESITRFSEQFRKKGHEVLIVAPEFKDTPEHETGVIRVPALLRFNHTDFSVNLPIPGLLWKIVKEFRPDIVHSHHPFLVGDMALRFCGQYDIPLVFTYHTMYEDYLHYIPVRNEQVKRFVIELVAGYANLTDHVIVPSQSVHDLLRKRGVDVPVSIIPTGVDIARFAGGDGAKIRRRFNIPDDAFVVGHVGRLAQEKNIEFLCACVGEFMKQRKNAHFLIVGQGPKADEISGIFKRQNIAGRLRMTGYLQGEDLIDGYHAMDVFAFCSHTETQGVVLAEAMAAGVPVVALDAPGAREIIRDRENGRLISSQDQRAFTEGLRWLMERSPEERGHLRDSARDEAKNYSIELCSQKVLDLYHSLKDKKFSVSQEKHNAWKALMDRIKTEWEMAKNIVEASEAALHSPPEAKKPVSAKDRHRKSWIIRIRRWLSRNEWAAWLLNLKQSKETEAHRGLVMIQIDGLSRGQIERALSAKRMPFLQRLLNTQHYKMYPLYTGLPSSTPSVQGELFYGVRQAVPAFAFFDRDIRRVQRMYDKEAAVRVERRLMGGQDNAGGKRRRGLLAHGSSYSNVYSGGARETHFCAVKIGWDMFWRGVNPFRLALLFVTHLLDFMRIGLLMGVETFIACFDFIFGIFSGENFGKELKFIPTRTFICILLRELVALGAKMDIARGVPIVHMNFLGYDEQAHRRGPSTRFAHRALRGIDHVIAQIYWQALRSTRRSYDVWVYSDHGQEDSESYIMKYGRTVAEAVVDIYKEFDAAGGSVNPQELSPRKQGLESARDHQGIESHRTRYIGGSLIRWLLPLIGIPGAEEEAGFEAVKGRVIVTAIGPTGNIYLPREMAPDERGRFARKLVEEAAIPAVLAPDGPGRVRVWREDGEFRLPEQAGAVLGEDHPYLKELTRDLIAICHHPHGGAFTLMGWRPGAKPLTFPIENGAHAGPGTEETNAFCLLPADVISPQDGPGQCSTQDLRASVMRFMGRKVPESSDAAARPAENPRTLRIMTYNVHSCVGMDGKILPERIARVISQHRPDIIALQELDLKRRRTGGMDQPHIIAKELEMIYYFHANIRIEEEYYGSAVLSRYPMRMIKSEKLPGLNHKPRLEPRGAIWCAVDLGDRELHFINTHLGLNGDERLAQAKVLCGPQWLEHPECRGPVVLSGDFNALPLSPVCRQIRQKLKDAQVAVEGHIPRATWFSHVPLGRIDHVFVSPDIEVVRVEVSSTDLERGSSDHLPLIVDVRLSGIVK